MRVCIIEPPFIEPGMPYPEIHRIAAVVNQYGSEACTVDANILLYSSLIRDSLGVGDRDNLYRSFAQSFFIDDISVFERQDGVRVGGMSARLFSALVNQDLEELAHLRQDALDRFSGQGFFSGHAQYVRDQELMNAFLDYGIKVYDQEASLSLDGFENQVDITFPASVLDFILDQGNSLIPLYEKHLRSEFSGINCHRMLVVIRVQEQLLPGLALSYWLKHHNNRIVAITGDFLNQALKRYFPDNIFHCADEVIMGKIDFSLEKWFSNDTSYPICRTPVDPPEGHIIQSQKRRLPLPGIVPQISTEMYFSPYPLTGATVSSRCYWSKCRFCGISCLDTHSFSQLSMEQLYEMLRGNLEENGVRHIQFCDYAMPPAFCTKTGMLEELAIQWTAQCRFEKQFTDPSLLSTMSRAGCTALSWGFESGSSKMLKACSKGGAVTAGARADILRFSFQAGISNHLFIITGIPGETEDDFRETEQFLEANSEYICGLEVHPFQLVPGTSYYQGVFNGAERSGGDWNFNMQYSLSESDTGAAIDRAGILNEKFGHLSVVSETNDLLEGHLAMIRTFRGETP